MCTLYYNMSIPLWEELHSTLDKVREKKRAQLKKIDFCTMLDIYCLYVAPVLTEENLRQGLLRNVQKGKQYYKMLEMSSTLCLTTRQFKLLIDYATRALHTTLNDTRFYIEHDRQDDNKTFTLFVCWAGAVP